MKQIEIACWELTKEEVTKLPDDFQILVYNRATQMFLTTKPRLARNYASFLNFFALKDPTEALKKSRRKK